VRSTAIQLNKNAHSKSGASFVNYAAANQLETTCFRLHALHCSRSTIMAIDTELSSIIFF